MCKYIDIECEGCEWWINPYGCTTRDDCQIYKDYQEGREEMAADDELERRKDERLGL